MKVLDVFCGAGGASYGFLTAGLEVIGGLDADPRAASTFEKNLRAPVLIRDAFRTAPRELVEAFGRPDVLIGCPPCQGFTRLRWGAGDDPRNNLVLRYLEFVEVLKPDFAVFENVEGFQRYGGGFYASLLVKKLRDLGYGVIEGVLNAADFGTPQMRRRYVVLAALRSRPRKPEPTHGDPLSESVKSGRLRPWRTVREVIGGLRPLNAGEADPDDPLHAAPKHTMKVLRFIRAIPKDGGSRLDVPRRLWLKCHSRLRNGFGDVYGRMKWDAPAPTITGGCLTPSKGRFVHPEQDRGITLREAALLQGFPKDYAFAGTRSSVASQIGNALPPPFASALARSLV